MPIIAKDSGGGADFAPAPAGPHQAVCADVHDLGIVEQTYEGKTTKKHMIRIYWEIDEVRDDNKPYLVGKRYTLSLHEKAGLRKDLESWRGKPFDEADLKDGFDVERLIGANCFLNIVHSAREGKTWANVSAIMPLPRNAAKFEVSKGFVRMKDRADKDQPSQPDQLPTDDDVPPADDLDALPF